MSKKHPHIENGTEAQLAELLTERNPEIQQIYIDMHRHIVTLLPDVIYATDTVDGVTSYGIRQYGYNGWGMSALSPHTKWVSLYFMHGTDLDDPEGLLEGTGKRMRHIKLRSSDDVKQSLGAITKLIEQARMLHSEE